MDALNEIILTATTALLTGGVSWIAFYKISKRLKGAEARKAEQDNDISLAKEWRDTAEGRERKLTEKELKIDALYVELSKWRDENYALRSQIHELHLHNVSMEYRVCNRRGCSEREPQTGF